MSRATGNCAVFPKECKSPFVLLLVRYVMRGVAQLFVTPGVISGYFIKLVVPRNVLFQSKKTLHVYVIL